MRQNIYFMNTPKCLFFLIFQAKRFCRDRTSQSASNVHSYGMKGGIGNLS